MEEFKDLLDKIDKAYIFGGSAVAERIFRLIDTQGKTEKIEGFLVSSAKSNPEQIRGKRVYELTDEKIDTSALVLMTVSESYHPEAYEAVRNRGFCNVISSMKWYNEDLSSSRDSAVGIEESIDHSIDKFLSHEQIEIRNRIVEKFFLKDHTFGDNRFYQSLPALGINGFRPTEVRLHEYDLERFLTKDKSVLDIGCNLGFLDLTLSEKVGYITGLEYSDSLIELGNMAKEALHSENVELICADYNEWEKSDNTGYDLILSFAVHIWLDISPEAYAKQCNGRLNKGGHLVFESQTLSGDRLFQFFVEEFIKVGLLIIDDRKIKDDGVTERRFVIFKK